MASIALQAVENRTRRADHRYTLEAPLHYEIVRGNAVLNQGFGTTVNISSGGVLFYAADPLPIGASIRLSIAWPARLNNQTALQLCVSGQVVRNQGACSAMAIQRHEFRTRRVS